MEQRGNVPFRSAWAAGALIVTVLALGLGLALSGLRAPEEAEDQPAAAVTEEVAVPDPAPAASRPEPKPVAKPVPMPEQDVPPAPPVVPEEPVLVVPPLQGEVAAAFSMDALAFDETLGDWRTHNGVDLSARRGTAVSAACAGTVLSVEDDPLMGTTVVLRHADGTETTYASLQAQPPVVEGDHVSAGEVIGAVGPAAPAEQALGPHLHFSVSKDGVCIDPQTFLGA